MLDHPIRHFSSVCDLGHLQLTMLSILVLVCSPIALAQEKPPETQGNGVAAAVQQVESEPSPLARELYEARSELDTMKQQLDSEREENRNLRVHLGEQEAATQASARALESAQSKLADLERRLEIAHKENTQLTAQFDEQQTVNRGMSEELEKVHSEFAATQQQLKAGREQTEELSAHLDQVQNHLEDARKLTRKREQIIKTVRAEKDQLAQVNLEQTREIEALRSNNRQLQHAADEYQKQLATLQAELPEADGGSASVGDLQDAGSAAAARLRENAQQLNARSNDPDALGAYQDAVHALAMQQLRLARATGAGGLYRVRTGDTLAQIARNNYGKLGPWKDVFEANQHILNNPNSLLPGMTLLIP